MSEDKWTWELASKAQGDLSGLEPNEQQRIIDKLDELVDSPWREPPDYDGATSEQHASKGSYR